MEVPRRHEGAGFTGRKGLEGERRGQGNDVPGNVGRLAEPGDQAGGEQGGARAARAVPDQAAGDPEPGVRDQPAAGRHEGQQTRGFEAAPQAGPGGQSAGGPGTAGDQGALRHPRGEDRRVRPPAIPRPEGEGSRGDEEADLRESRQPQAIGYPPNDVALSSGVASAAPPLFLSRNRPRQPILPRRCFGARSDGLPLTSDELPLLATSCRYWRRAAATGDGLPLLATGCRYWRRAAATSDELPLLATGCRYWRRAAATGDELSLLATSCRYWLRAAASDDKPSPPNDGPPPADTDRRHGRRNAVARRQSIVRDDGSSSRSAHRGFAVSLRLPF